MARTTKAAPAAKNDSGKEIVTAVHELAKLKGLNEDMLFTTIEEAIRQAYKKNLPRDAVEPANIVVRMDRETGEYRVFARLMVVEEVENETSQISLEEATAIRPAAQLDDIVDKDITPKGFMRVAAQQAKQHLVQRIREAERGRVYDEYADKTDEILTAVVERIGEKDVFVELGGTAGILESDQMIPGETLHEGDHVKVYLLEVLRNVPAGSHMPQVRVSRTHPNLVKRLFELEVPEIAAGQVVIKSIAREAGSRTKIAVHANDPMIDPVGACVGQRGGRVDRVVNELRGEKIDIIKWSEDPAEFLANALNPAHVLRVYTIETGERICRVVVPDGQLSLAIGKEGQNARLAAKLTGWKIDIKSQSQAAEATDMVDETDYTMPMGYMTHMEYDPSAGVQTDDDTI